MTMLVCISGETNAQIEAPLLKFKNKERNYQIQSVPDNIPGVAFQTGPKRWRDSKNVLAWLKKPHIINVRPRQ